MNIRNTNCKIDEADNSIQSTQQHSVNFMYQNNDELLYPITKENLYKQKHLYIISEHIKL